MTQGQPGQVVMQPGMQPGQVMMQPGQMMMPQGGPSGMPGLSQPGFAQAPPVSPSHPA